MPNSPDRTENVGNQKYMDSSVNRRVAKQKLIEDNEEGEPSGKRP